MKFRRALVFVAAIGLLITTATGAFGGTNGARDLIIETEDDTHGYLSIDLQLTCVTDADVEGSVDEDPLLTVVLTDQFPDSPLTTATMSVAGVETTETFASGQATASFEDVTPGQTVTIEAVGTDVALNFTREIPNFDDSEAGCAIVSDDSVDASP